MQRLVYSMPPEWRTTAPGKYELGGAVVAFGELAPLPEDLRAAVARQAGIAPAETYEKTFASGFVAWVGEGTKDGGTRSVAMAVQVVDQGVLVALDAPESEYATARTVVFEALAEAKIEWGAGAAAFSTVAEWYEGVRSK